VTHIVGRFCDHGAARSGVRFAAVPLTPRQRALIPYVMWVFIAALIVIAAVQERWASAVVFALFLVTGIIAFHAAPPVPRWITECRSGHRHHPRLAGFSGLLCHHEP
jgi:hypothetical protein